MLTPERGPNRFTTVTYCERARQCWGFEPTRWSAGATSPAPPPRHGFGKLGGGGEGVGASQRWLRAQQEGMPELQFCVYQRNVEAAMLRLHSRVCC